MNKNGQIASIPFLKILPPVVIGILVANAVAIPLWASAVGLAATLTGAILSNTIGSNRKGGGHAPTRAHITSALTTAAILFFALLMTGVTQTREMMPHGERLVMTMTITDNPHTTGRWTKATARIDEYRSFYAEEAGQKKREEKSQGTEAKQVRSNNPTHSLETERKRLGEETHNSEVRAQTSARTHGAEVGTQTSDRTHGAEVRAQANDRTHGAEVRAQANDRTHGAEVGTQTSDRTHGAEVRAQANDRTNGAEVRAQANDRTNGAKVRAQANDRTNGAEVETQANDRIHREQAGHQRDNNPAHRLETTSRRSDVKVKETEAGWKRSGEKVVVRFDTTHKVSVGARLITTGYAGALGSPEYAGYLRLMQRRGYSQTVWVDGRQETIILPGIDHTPRYYASRMQAAASERLARLHLTPASKAVATAMSIGDKSDISRPTRDEYSLSGASHLLAVSGLHVGIVMMLINLLLWLLPAFRYGHIIKNVIAIVVIWLYAMVTGLSPSVVRAAMMFSGAQIALATSRNSARANIILATATVMLLLNPNYLYDVSFLLSFAAIAGIFTLYKPLYDLMRSRFPILNAFWAVFMVGIAATLATAPLVSYYFGRIPLIGIIINPILILTANITVLLSLLWVIMPIPLLNGVFSTIIEYSAGAQNSIVSVSAAKSWASLPVNMNEWEVITTYVVAVAAYMLIRRKIAAKRKKRA